MASVGHRRGGLQLQGPLGMMPGAVGDENAVAKPYIASGTKGLGSVRGKMHPNATGTQQGGLKDASARNGLGESGGKLRTPGASRGLGLYKDGAGGGGGGTGEGVSGAGDKTAGGGLKRAPRAALRNITNATPRPGGLGGGLGGGKGLSAGKGMGGKGLGGGVAVMVDGPKGLASQASAVLRDPTGDSLRGAAGAPEVSQPQAQGQEGVREGGALGESEFDVLAAKYASEGEGFERWAGMAGDDYARMLQAQEDAEMDARVNKVLSLRTALPASVWSLAPNESSPLDFDELELPEPLKSISPSPPRKRLPASADAWLDEDFVMGLTSSASLDTDLPWDTIPDL